MRTGWGREFQGLGGAVFGWEEGITGGGLGMVVGGISRGRSACHTLTPTPGLCIGCLNLHQLTSWLSFKLPHSANGGLTWDKGKNIPLPWGYFQPAVWDAAQATTAWLFRCKWGCALAWSAWLRKKQPWSSICNELRSTDVLKFMLSWKDLVSSLKYLSKLPSRSSSCLVGPDKHVR